MRSTMTLILIAMNARLSTRNVCLDLNADLQGFAAVICLCVTIICRRLGMLRLRQLYEIEQPPVAETNHM